MKKAHVAGTCLVGRFAHEFFCCEFFFGGGSPRAAKVAPTGDTNYDCLHMVSVIITMIAVPLFYWFIMIDNDS